MMCNLDSESVAIERIREYDNLPQVTINAIPTDIVLKVPHHCKRPTASCRRLLGRRPPSSPLQRIGQTEARYLMTTIEIITILSFGEGVLALSFHNHNFQLLVDNVTASHAPNLPPALCDLSLRVHGGEKVLLRVKMFTVDIIAGSVFVNIG